jgi:catechol 2,3-dioxygenase-like lactoylglutathione lyase family enzyme
VFDHVVIRVSDRQASRRFYETVLSAIGLGPRRSGTGVDQWWEFMIAQATIERPVTRAAHVAFVTRSRDEVDTFWRAGTRAGYTSDGEPGPRTQYGDGYYGGFLLDPDGNSAEAVWLGRPRRGPGIVDHLWIRVADLERSRRFYDAIAPALGLQVGGDHPDRFSVRGEDRSFTLVHDPRPVTENLHLAFPVRRDADVQAFHAAGVAAGGTDNGEPGERGRYHPGYYAAFVLDPDGTNVEAVNHNR